MGKKKKSGFTSNFLVQGSILAIAGLIVRIIGLLYRVPLTNIIGEEGIGIYSTAYSIYNILLLISSYSLPLAVSRLVAARISLGQYRNARRIFFGALLFAACSGGLMCAITFFGADFFAGVMKMPQASYAIKTLAPTILIMAFLGVFRGYFQGHNTMIPTAFSQIAEQIVNAVVSIAAGYFLFLSGAARDLAEGLEDYYSAAFGAAGGTIGTGAGALTALLFCIVVYIFFRRVERIRCHRDRTGSEEAYSYVMKILIMTILPVLISTTIYQISSVIDQGIFAQYIGGDYEGIWGAYSGKYLLMIHVPTAIASSMGSSIIPTLAAAISQNDRKAIVRKTGMAIRFNMIIAIPATVGLAVLAGPIMNLLFTGDNTTATSMMIMGSTAVVFTALSTITNSVLQGIGKIWVPVRNAMISLALHIISLVILLWGFRLGIYGVIIGNILFYVFMCLLNQLSIRRRLKYRQEFTKTFVCPIFSSAIMGLAAALSYQIFYALTHSNAFSLILAIVLAIAVYAVMLLVTKGVEEQDLRSFPKGELLIRIAKKLHLLH